MGRTFVDTLLLVVGITASAAGAPGAFAGNIQLTFHAAGALSADRTIKQAQDDAHTCTLLGPSEAEQTFVLAFNERQTSALIPPSDFGLSLSISGIVGQVLDERHPSTILQVMIDNKRFVGLRVSDENFHIRASVQSGAKSGRFKAIHLVERPGEAVIDADGSWEFDIDGAGDDVSPPIPRGTEVKTASLNPAESTPLSDSSGGSGRSPWQLLRQKNTKPCYMRARKPRKTTTFGFPILNTAAARSVTLGRQLMLTPVGNWTHSWILFI